MKKEYRSIIESCRETASECKACTAAIISNGGNKECEKICLDCAAICELCVTLGESKSLFFKQAIELCITACKKCIDVCNDVNNESCNNCVQQCRICIAECQSILEESSLKF